MPNTILSTARLARHIFGGIATLAAIAGTQSALAAPYSDYAQTSGEAAVAAVFDGANTAPSGDRATMLQSIDDLTTAAERADALGQLSARSYTLLPRLSILSMDSHDRQIRNYLIERRNIAADAPSSVPTSGPGTITMMLTGGLKQGSFEGRTDRPSANADSRSLRFAIDIRPIQNLIVGATLGIDGIDANLDRAQRPRITNFNAYVGPYASYSNGKFYVDVTTGYNLSEYRLRRQVSWSGFTDRMAVAGVVEGDGWGATAEVGGMLRAGNVRVQPFVGLSYRYADVESFSESGGPAALDVANYQTKSVRSSVGARVSTTVEKGKWAIRPTASAEWQRELRSRPDSRIEARFATRDLTVFTLKPTRLARDAALVDVGVTATHDSKTSFRLGYTGEFSSDRHVHAFGLTVSRRF